jgi:hypothetical protein
VPPVFCVPVPNLLLLAPVPILPLSDEVSAMLPGPHFAASGALLFGIDPPLIPPPAVCASAMPPARTKDKVAASNVLDLDIWFLPKNCRFLLISGNSCARQSDTRGRRQNEQIVRNF